MRGNELKPTYYGEKLPTYLLEKGTLAEWEDVNHPLSPLKVTPGSERNVKDLRNVNESSLSIFQTNAWV